MKNLLIIIITAFVLVRCTDESKIRIPDIPGGVNLRMVLDPLHTGIFTDKIATDFVAIDVYSENKDLSIVELYAANPSKKKLMKSLTQADFDSGNGKVRLEFKATDFAKAFDIPGYADGTKAENFAITPLVRLTDGRVYPSYVKFSAKDSVINLAPSINGAPTSSFTTGLNTFITCPPVDISGDYEVVSATGVSTDDCCKKEVTVKGNIVKVTRATLSSFKLSDLTGGLYFEWYDVFGLTKPEDSPGEFAFSCGNVFIQNSPEPFGDKFSGQGKFDPTLKTIVYEFTNGYGDVGKVILKKK